MRPTTKSSSKSSSSNRATMMHLLNVVVVVLVGTTLVQLQTTNAFTISTTTTTTPPATFGVTTINIQRTSRKKVPSTTCRWMAEENKEAEAESDFPSMFSGAAAEEGSSAAAAVVESTDMSGKQEVMNLGKGGSVEEVKWTDPSMEANSNFFNMSWWGYVLLIYPALLILDDAFHFLPKDNLIDIKNILNRQ